MAIKFKVGDKVRLKRGAVWGFNNEWGTVAGVDRNAETEMHYLLRFGDRAFSYWQEDADIIGLFDGSGERTSVSPPKFILQYELDTDPFELIGTKKELRQRITELAGRSDLKRDSIKVYEIKKVRTVKLGVKFTLSK